MIFVVVGTHEQPFDRLVQHLDRLKETNRVTHDIYIQTGYSSTRPRYCQHREFLPFDETMKRMAEADIVITHGGTGSVMLALYHGKIPVVTPRQRRYNEHIDDHQVLFCKTLESRNRILAVYDMEDLEATINNYENLVRPFRQFQQCQSEIKNKLNDKSGLFSKQLNEICLRLMDKK
ncbi:MAG: glycosyltransferase [Candidatus Omnitrophota bacterium]